MPDDRLKFRCYRCNQLIGVPPKRAGSVVNCPKCKAELAVPQPETSSEASPFNIRTDSSGGSGRSAGPEVGGRPRREGIPLEIEGIEETILEDLETMRPEDIRVVEEFAGIIVAPAEPLRPEATGYERRVAVAVADDFEVSLDHLTGGVSTPASALTETSGQAGQSSIGEVVLPAISVEAPTIRKTEPDRHPVREVVLHPGIVLAWSLLVLMAVPMAFLAGLMIGHFVWK